MMAADQRSLAKCLQLGGNLRLEPAGEVEKLRGEVELGLSSILTRCELSQLGAPRCLVREWAVGERREMKGGQGLGEEVLPLMVLEWAGPLVE